MKIFKLTRKGRLTMAQKAGKYAAAVGCSGGELARRKIPREALTGDCRQALAEHPEGILECRWGCLGLGSCAAVCKLGAIKVGARGVAEVDRDKCVGCGLCVKACPQGIIRLVPREQNIVVGCSRTTIPSLMRASASPAACAPRSVRAASSRTSTASSGPRPD